MVYYLNIYQELINKNNMKNSNKLEKHIWEGWRVIDFIEDLEPLFNQIMSGHAITKPFKTRNEIKQFCMTFQPGYKKYIKEVVDYFYNLIK